MLSIKTVSPSASAERLAEQVSAEMKKFFEEEQEQAIKRLREQGLYLFPSGSEIANNIYIEARDNQGAKFWIPMKESDELRDPVGRCISCGLTIGSKRGSACYMGCRNTNKRLYPLEGQPIILATLIGSDRKWVLTRERYRFTLTQQDGIPEKPKASSPKVKGILKNWI